MTVRQQRRDDGEYIKQYQHNMLRNLLITNIQQSAQKFLQGGDVDNNMMTTRQQGLEDNNNTTMVTL